jgi:hypothetical protein
MLAQRRCNGDLPGFADQAELVDGTARSAKDAGSDLALRADQPLVTDRFAAVTRWAVRHPHVSRVPTRKANPIDERGLVPEDVQDCYDRISRRSGR